MARTTPVHTGYTIVNGSGTGTNGYRIQVWAEYTFGEPNTKNNTVPLTLYFYTALDPAYTSSTRGSGLDSSLKIGSVQATGVENGQYNFTSSSNVHLLGSYQGNVAYGADGTGTVTVSGSFTTASSYISGGTLQATLTLPSIIRATTLGATDAVIGQVSVIALSVLNPAYTHAIACSFGKLQGYIDQQGQYVEEETRLTGQSISFRVPELFYRQILTTQSGVCTLTCYTYLNGKLVGQPQQATFTVRVNVQDCKPSAKVVLQDTYAETIALTGNPGILVRNQSLVRCQVETFPQYGASITSVKLNGVTLKSNDVIIGAPGNGEMILEVIDSRGVIARFPVEPEGWVEYIPVTNLSSARRESPASETVIVTLYGSYWNESFGAVENTLTVQYCLGQGTWQDADPALVFTDGHYEGSLTLTGLPYTNTYSLQVRVQDALHQANKTLTIQRGVPVFDWGEQDFEFHVPVTAPSFNSPEIKEMMSRIKKLEDTINGSN